MKQTFNDQERKHLDQRIADAEKRTGTQIVMAIVERSDTYSEIPWKAFALGTSLAGLLTLLMNLASPAASPAMAALLAIVMMLSAGAGLALLCVFVPDFARLFLHIHRAEVETKQYAESLFLSRQMFGARDRRAVLLMVSLFERWIVVLPDKGLAQKLNQNATETIIQHMRMDLKAGKTARALDAGLTKLEEIITQPESPNELPNVIEEKGV